MKRNWALLWKVIYWASILVPLFAIAEIAPNNISGIFSCVVGGSTIGLLWARFYVEIF